MKAFLWEPRMRNSVVERRCVVCGVRGTEIRSMSRFWERKVCKAGFEVPLYQASGILPSGSPVLGTM